MRQGGLAFVPLHSLDINSSQGEVVTLGEAVTFGQEQLVEEDSTSSCQQAIFPAVGGIRAQVLGGIWVGHICVFIC